MMATITLNGNTLSGRLGAGSFLNLGSSFSNAQKTTSSLSKELGTLKSKVDAVNTAVSVDAAPVQEAKICEEKKTGALSCAYAKLDEFISDVCAVDNDAAAIITKLKKDFYKLYRYLKPNSERNLWDAFLDYNEFVWSLKVWAAKKIFDFLVDCGKWCKEHWLAIVIAIAIVVLAVVLVVVFSVEIAVVCAVAAIVGLVLLVADVICMICNDGKGIPETLEENGHPYLADVFRGVDIGCTLVQILLPLGAAVKAMSKVGVKTFAKTSIEAFKASFKETGESILENGFKKGFKEGMKNTGKFLFKTFILDPDDYNVLKAGRIFRDPAKSFTKAELNIIVDDFNSLVGDYVSDLVSDFVIDPIVNPIIEPIKIKVKNYLKEKWDNIVSSTKTE